MTDAPERVATALSAFLAAQMPSADDIQITNVQRMGGGASREAWIFDVSVACT